MIEYAGIMILAILAAGAVLLFLVLTTVLGPKRPNPAKDEPFECGVSPEIKKGGVSLHFYLIAMLFIIFDVELAFLFPWAVSFKKLGMIGLIEISVFVFFIVLGYVYALRKGALEVE
jgi:NADH-quinone oxidoreductase subunit A